MRCFSRISLVVLLAVFASVAGSPGATASQGPTVASGSHTIAFPVGGFHYSPADITIFAGDDVEWQGPFTFHPLVSEDGLWTVVNTGDSFRFTFTQPGVYRYYCQIHGGPGGVGMSGMVRVISARSTYLPAVFR